MQAIPQTLQFLARGEAPGLGIWLMAIGFAAVCIIMMLVVLIQKPKGGGLSGAFGGGAGGGSSQAFVGGGIGNVLTVVTVICFLIFLGLACSMTLAINADDEPPAEEDDTKQVDDTQDAPKAGEAAPPAITPDVKPTEPQPDETTGDDNTPAAEADTSSTSPAEAGTTEVPSTKPSE